MGHLQEWLYISTNKGANMNYGTNDFDRKFNEALDEIAKEQNIFYTKQEIEDMYQQCNISNPMKLYGAI